MQTGGVESFNGIRVLIVGLAREGTALARFLAERGARVTVNDCKPAEELAARIALLAGLPVSCVFGGHPIALLDEADMVFASPGVPLELALLETARQRGLPISSETRFFTHLCPAPVIGITGSSGKTTTTALVGEMARAAGYRTWVGGNIGQPLTEHLAEILPADRVVMELSSFQLEFFAPSENQGDKAGRLPAGLRLDSAGWSPPIAAMLNITPNHLDRHPSMEAYIAAKTQIVAHQQAGDTTILNLDDPVTRQLGQNRPRQRVLWFSMEQRPEEGTYLNQGALMLRMAGREEVICQANELLLIGRHNVANVLAACATAAAAGAPAPVLRHVVISFKGVEHRLELIRDQGGVCWYNDSIATSPERSMAALRAFEGQSIVLLAGGRDKHLPWEELASLAWRSTRHMILFGEAAGLIEEAMAQARGRSSGACHVHRVEDLAQAVRLASRLVRPGDAVLFSPGGTSFDAYLDFAQRGDHFRKLVQDLE